MWVLEWLGMVGEVLECLELFEFFLNDLDQNDVVLARLLKNICLAKTTLFWPTRLKENLLGQNDVANMFLKNSSCSKFFLQTKYQGIL